MQSQRLMTAYSTAGPSDPRDARRSGSFGDAARLSRLSTWEPRHGDLAPVAGRGRASLNVPGPDATLRRSEAEFWRDLVQQLGCEIAMPMTALLDCLPRLCAAGAINPSDLADIQHHIEAARRAGMIGQQMARLSAGAVRQRQETLDLRQMVRRVLGERHDEVKRRHLQIQPLLCAASVMADASLLTSLLHTLLDWVGRCAAASVELRVEMRPWPNRARLVCEYVPRHMECSETGRPAFADDLSWRLLKQTARTMGLEVHYEFGAKHVKAAFEFPRTVNVQVQGLSALECDPAPGAARSGAKTLACRRLLVVASRREVRIKVRDAIRHMGLQVSFAKTVPEAVAYCRAGLPHAIVIESALRDRDFDDLAECMAADQPESVFIEIAEGNMGFEISGFTGTDFARVGCDAIADSLPMALTFEMSKMDLLS